MNLSINITETGMHIINYTCPTCFNFSTCPLPIQIYRSNYQVNWIWLFIVIAVAVYLMYRLYDKPWIAVIISTAAVVLLSFIGAFFGLISGLLLVIITIVMVIVGLWKYKQELGI